MGDSKAASHGWLTSIAERSPARAWINCKQSSAAGLVGVGMGLVTQVQKELKGGGGVGSVVAVASVHEGKEWRV